MRWFIGIVVLVVVVVLGYRLFQTTPGQAQQDARAADDQVRLAPEHLREVQGWATQVDLTRGIPSDEADRGREFQTAINEVQRAVAVSPNRLERGQHAKGLYATNNGEISFAPNLPSSLQAGPIQPGAKYRFVARLSNAADRVAEDDSDADRRGLALSILGPDGKSQDMLFTTGASEFLAENADAAVAAASAAATNGPLAKGKAFADLVLQIGPIDTARLVVAAKTTTDSDKSIAGQTLFSRAPYTLGDHVVKLRLVSMQPDAELLDRDHLGKDMAAHRGHGDVSYRIEVMDGSTAMEDARQGDGPWVPIGQLRFPQQGVDEARDDRVFSEIESRRFSPFQRWDDADDRALLPVGSVNWARKYIYDASSELRGSIGPAADCPCISATSSTAAAPRATANPP